jgi:hypothetical protein
MNRLTTKGTKFTKFLHVLGEFCGLIPGIRPMLKSLAAIVPLLLAWAMPAYAAVSDCLEMAEGPARAQVVNFSPTALEANEVRLTFIGHSTFLIESPAGIKIATDYAGYSGGVLPDVVTMNHAHPSHYTDTPDPAIKYVLRGWNPAGGPARHDLQVGDVHIRNVTTDIRSGLGRVPDGNSIFIFEVAGLCIGHLGHLHQELTPAQFGLIDPCVSGVLVGLAPSSVPIDAPGRSLS